VRNVPVPHPSGLIGIRDGPPRVARRKDRRNTDAGDFDAAVEFKCSLVQAQEELARGNLRAMFSFPKKKSGSERAGELRLLGDDHFSCDLRGSRRKTSSKGEKAAGNQNQA